jgi:hypothetical protein
VAKGGTEAKAKATEVRPAWFLFCYFEAADANTHGYIVRQMSLVWLCWQLPHVCGVWVCVVGFAKVFLYHHLELQGKRPTHVWACPGCPLSVSSRPLFGHVAFMSFMLLRASGWLDIAPPLRAAAHCVHLASLYPAVTILCLPRWLATSLNYGILGALAFLDLATPDFNASVVSGSRQLWSLA